MGHYANQSLCGGKGSCPLGAIFFFSTDQNGLVEVLPTITACRIILKSTTEFDAAAQVNVNHGLSF